MLVLLYMHAKLLSHVWLFVTQETVDNQAPLSLGFPRQEYWYELPFPTPRDLFNPGIKPVSLMSPALADRFFTASAIWDAQSLWDPLIIPNV